MAFFKQFMLPYLMHIQSSVLPTQYSAEFINLREKAVELNYV